MAIILIEIETKTGIGKQCLNVLKIFESNPAKHFQILNYDSNNFKTLAGEYAEKVKKQYHTKKTK